MNYYPHHIGDFDKATRHLTRLERSIYRDLIDVYYDTEQLLTLDLPDLCRKIIATSNDEPTVVERMLNEFFTKTPEGWFHDRCQKEIGKYHAKAEQASRAGKASAAKRTFNGRSTDVPLTNNQNQEPKPVTKEKETRKRAAPPPEKPESVLQETWDDWLQLRKQKNAAVTGTVLREASNEAHKAGMTLERFLQIWCARGSQGLQADWLKPAEMQAKSSGKHTGFNNLNYREGVQEDGSLI